ncbi:hypothetical protein BJV74DRAFT_953536 [Russula compacta]|nr:hypothetical protein BJV74DRAFT_953536 [Russula compacta]
MALKNVIQVGATGTLGPTVLEALIASKKFNVTVGTRDASSSHSFPAGVKVVQMTIRPAHLSLLEQIQTAVVDAAVEAGVSHIIPSNFGGDLASHRNPVVEFKLRVKSTSKALAEGKSAIPPSALAFSSTGFLIPRTALTIGFFGIDLVNKKAVLLNDGNSKLDVTNLSSIAETIVTILSKPDLVKNRLALIHDLFISQNDVLKIVEEELGTKFEVSHINTEDLRRQSEAGLATGDPAAVFGLIKAAAWGSDSPCAWGVDDDSKVLGHAPKDLRGCRQGLDPVEAISLNEVEIMYFLNISIFAFP